MSNLNESSSVWLDDRANSQRRINALLNLQADYFRLRVDFYRKLQQVQCSFNADFDQLFDRRRQMIEQYSLNSFWLKVLKTIDTYDFAVQIDDEECLKYLIDIRCRHEPDGFILEFHFCPNNPFFHETILKKFYSIRFEFNETNPYRLSDGPEIDQCSSSPLTWKEGRNFTMKKCEKRRRHRTTGHVRTVQVDEKIPSFFDLFLPIEDNDQIRLDGDIEYGLLLKQRIIPRAILCYIDEDQN